MKRGKLILFFLFLAVLPVKAQFYSLGDEQGSQKWNFIETGTYRIVYPHGADSLARVYARYLENSADAVGSSIGYRPNCAYRKKMPVILHNAAAYSNGMVTWTPRRMELYTSPEAYGPDVIPWVEELAIHESRHVAQMQFSKADFRFLNVLTGELTPGALSAVYPGPAFLEGDAVLAETALSGAGRGRSGDFLEYMRASFAAGDYRDYWKWRYGSQRYYTPDYYRAGYMAMAGIRTLYDIPDFTARYYKRIKDHHGIAFNNFEKTVRESTGLEFKDAFREICGKLDSTWRAEAEARGPHMAYRKVTPDQHRFTSFGNLESFRDSLYAVRSGLTHTAELVKVATDGGYKRISSFASQVSSLKISSYDGRLYWSEEAPDPRWSLKSYSDIRFLDNKGKKKTLTRHHRYFNPAPAPDKSEISVTEYFSDGSCAVAVISDEDGRALQSWKAPDGMQIAETEWLDGRIYATAITDEGFGIWEIPSFRNVLAPRKIKINSLRTDGHGRLVFISDLDGVNELYSILPDGTDARRMSSTANGASDFVFHKDTLFFTVLEPDGRKVCKTAINELMDIPVDFSQGLHEYPMAGELSAAEPLQPDFSTDCEISAPKNYSKLGHLLKFHSWAPLYVDYDSISDLSFDAVQQSAGLGAMAFFQNELGSASGYGGVKLDWKDWRPSGHLRFDYRGWYPVIETSLDFNDRNAGMYKVTKEERSTKAEFMPRPAPLVQLDLKTYVPLNFSGGGWQRGLVPQLRYAYSNDLFDGRWMGRLTGNFRAYIMKGIPSSCIYPRLGVGVEFGVSGRPGLSDMFCTNAYGYIYGYLPGIARTHGMRMSLLAQMHSDSGTFTEAYASTAPRGFGYDTSRILSAYPYQMKATFDYALPFAALDWSGLCPVAYLRNFELTLHGDLTMYSAPAAKLGGNLFSVGADLAARLGNFLWIPYDTRIGVSYNRLGGSGFEAQVSEGAASGHDSVSMVFTIDF